MAAKSAYGLNFNAGRNPNANLDWGPYQWPGGVPGSLLGVATIPGPVKVVVRAELVPLVEAAFNYINAKYGRTFVRGWTGGYENRPISGSSSPSNHSKGKAIDLDAQFNPMSYVWQCDIDPGIVADLESFGFYWGGRYSGKTDPMHFEYCWPKGEVVRHLNLAQAALAKFSNQPVPQTPTPVPVPPTTTPAPTPTSKYETYVDAPVGSRNVQLYSNGSDVAHLQALLSLPEDGKFGPNTDAAVRSFQSSHGLNSDGVVGLKTWQALQTPTGPVFPLPAGYYYGPRSGPKESISGLAPGTNPAWIQGLKDAQAQLNKHLVGSNQSAIRADGKYGDITAAAIRWYQTARQWPPFNLGIDGLIGPATWNSLWK